MTHVDRETLVRRYAEGAMSAGEEHEFFIYLATDEELRRLLKAVTIVDSAIRKERDAIPSTHTRLRASLAGRLATTPGTSDTEMPRLRNDPGTGSATSVRTYLQRGGIIVLLLTLVGAGLSLLPRSAVPTTPRATAGRASRVTSVATPPSLSSTTPLPEAPVVSSAPMTEGRPIPGATIRGTKRANGASGEALRSPHGGDRPAVNRGSRQRTATAGSVSNGPHQREASYPADVIRKPNDSTEIGVTVQSANGK